ARAIPTTAVDSLRVRGGIKRLSRRFRAFPPTKANVRVKFRRTGSPAPCAGTRPDAPHRFPFPESPMSPSTISTGVATAKSLAAASLCAVLVSGLGQPAEAQRSVPVEHGGGYRIVAGPVDV